MGCAQSKIENEEAVSRCKERKQFMKEAVGFRNAFAAAHSAYAVSLKNTGAALSDYAQAEAQDVLRPSPAAPAGGSGPPSSSAPPPVVKPPSDESFPPPPPLPPDFSPSPLQRSASMPDIPLTKPRRRRSLNDQTSPAEASIREEEDGDELEDDARGDAVPAESASPAPPPRPPPQPEREPEPSPVPPPPPENKPTTWDYFFGMEENMHGTSLGGTEEIRTEKDGREEEVAKYKRAASAASTSAAVDADIAGVDVVTPPLTPEKVAVEPPMPPPKQMKKQKASAHHQHAASVGSVDARKGKMVPSTTPSVTLLQVLTDLDEHFLRASESAQEVSKMLEANRLHYHSNFADNRGG